MDTETNFLGGEGIWLFAILALLWGGNGGLFGGNQAASRAATVEDLNTTTNFSRLENQVQSNGATTERKADGIVNGISSLGYETAQQFGNTNTQIAQGFCNTSKEILESRYLNEKATSDSAAAVAAQINALSAKIDQNKIESLQAQVSELKTQNMFCGIPRINPYGYGVYPYNAYSSTNI